MFPLSSVLVLSLVQSILVCVQSVLGLISDYDLSIFGLFSINVFGL